MSDLRKSPLDDRHRALGAKMVEFGGWEMPVAYTTGTLAEHLACRDDAAMFDVSHLGTVRIAGADAFDLLQANLSNDLGKIAPGRAQYTHLLDDDDGSVLDDIIVWWIADDLFDVMPNASNTERVRTLICGHETTGERAIIAVQGPNARRRLSEVSADAAAVGRALFDIKKRPAVFRAYDELYQLSLLRPHRTVTFRGFEQDELRAADAAMVVAPAADMTNGSKAVAP